MVILLVIIAIRDEDYIMLSLLLKLLGDPNERKIKKVMPIVEHINSLEPEFAQMSNEVSRLGILAQQNINISKNRKMDIWGFCFI